MKNLIVVCDNASELAENNQAEFAAVRRVGFGASDSSILLGVNPFPDGTIDKLNEKKRSLVVTPEELAIGQMVNVRKGSDLEPIILGKFRKAYSVAEESLEKPTAMYRIGDTALTVNFDGILQLPPIQVPVECKFISNYGSKYYDFGKALGSTLNMGGDLKFLGDEVNEMYLVERAKEAGIPIYYYTQIQQQLFALDAPFGYLTTLFEKDWILRTFKIIADPNVHARLLELAEYYWEQV